MKYLPLFNLQLTHSYYTDGRCPDFLITSASKTVQLLKNHRCVLKLLPTGLRVLMAVTGADQPLIPLPSGATFTFQLWPRNPDFALITDLTAIDQARAPLFTNADLGSGHPANLVLTSRRAWSTEIFTVQQPADDEPFTLSGQPLEGLLKSDFAIASLGTTTQPATYDAASRVITADTSAAAKGDTFDVTYKVAPRRTRGMLAEVDLHVNDSLPDVAAGPGQFEIAFQTKQTRWVYYLVTDQQQAGSQFQIEDKGSTPLHFGSANKRDLNQQPDPADNVAEMLARQYPQMQRIRFMSDERVLCQQQARKSIQLRLNGLQVPGTLPNPSPRNFAMINVTNNGGVQLEDSLYQLVKYVRSVQ